MIETGSFCNDMTTFESSDDVLTLLVHLGYLGYDFIHKEAFIPNYEITLEFMNAIRSAKWDEVILAVKRHRFPPQTEPDRQTCHDHRTEMGRFC